MKATTRRGAAASPSRILSLIALAVFLSCGSGTNSAPLKEAEMKGRKPNHLIHEKSPYLLQHAYNPVDWHPWGEEAFEKARKEDKPVFLSVGYSACHWCHVMERESFENEEVAKILNEHFVSVKVDREERPDVDNLYMAAVQMMTRSGGWPMTVVMTPDGKPFFGGTYFPPDDRAGRRGFKSIMLELAEAWRNNRDEVAAVAERTAAALKQRLTPDESGADEGGEMRGEAVLDSTLVGDIVDGLARRFDPRNGGFGSRPKFPPHNFFPVLFSEYRRTREKETLEMATLTLDAMALGGIHDHLGGGFHRYSTDSHWLVPHFEKMLYDNAQLLRAYAEGWSVTKNGRYRGAARGIVAWLDREMTHEEGGFYSTLDADSEGEEGKYYVWDYDEILKILGEEEGKFFAKIYNAEPAGNFREEAAGEDTGRNILHLTEGPDEAAARLGTEPKELEARLAEAREKLLERRATRVRPALDDKVLASWNALMIGALAHAGKTFDEPGYVERAERAARFVLKRMRTKEGRLLHSFREGEGKIPAFLEDYAYLADAFVTLHEATGKDAWLGEAKALADQMVQHFLDEKSGGFFFTADDQESLLVRLKDPYDSAVPSPNGVAAQAFLRLHRATNDARYLEHGRGTLAAFAGTLSQMPQALTTLVMALPLLPEGKLPAKAEPAEEESPVEASASVSPGEARPGQKVELVVRLDIAEKWHVNARKPREEYLIPTEVRVENLPEGLKAGEVDYPKEKLVKLGFSDAPLAVYDGRTEISVPLTVAKDAQPGPRTLTAKVRFQACDDSRCLPPEERTVSATLEIADGR
ncbi:MAG: DUF255 domain-containing protein [Acidobacteriota bacterium]|nr:MAG: DUF255 domain-containing protein [Acidobacteriota bacterium]